MSKNHVQDGSKAVTKFVALVEMATSLSAEVAKAAAKAGSAEKDAIGDEVEPMLQSFTAIAAAGTMVIAALVAARLQIDRLNEQLANLNSLDKVDSKPVDDEVKSMVTETLKNIMARKE